MAHRAWLALVLAFGASACATILGNDYEIVTKDGGSTTGSAGADTKGDGGTLPTKGGTGGDIDGSDDAPSDGPVCAPSEFRCKEAVLESCNDDRSGWASSATCVSAALCDATTGKCLTPVCEPGDHKCDGADLQICDTGQSGWKFVSTCTGGPQFCDTTQGMCVDTPCVKGDVQCAGKELQVCTGDATGWMTTDTCSSSTLCDATSKKCNVATCAAGQHQCTGANLEVCNGTLTGWDPVSMCTTAALCDKDKGQCIAPVCQPSDHRCDPAAPANLQVCNPTQSGWAPVQTCLSAAYCNASRGMCDAAPCTVGQYSCSGTELQRCKPDQTGWEHADTCVTSALCDANAKVCNPPVCAATDHTCVGGILYNCNSGRTGLGPGPNCGSQTLCDAANGRCNVCVPNLYTCQGADLYRCAANGQSNSKITTCSSVMACNPTLGACNQCPTTGRGPTMVNVGSFCIDSTEVTNVQYQAFLSTSPSPTSLNLHNRCTFNKINGFTPAQPLGPDNYPVVYVDWCDAYAFCTWAGKRMCGQIGGTSNPTNQFLDATKDQWYQACTNNNPAMYAYPYGNTYQPLTCNGYQFNQTGMTNVKDAVNCHGPSAPYNGVFDMSGNADEWEDSCDLVTTGSATHADGRFDACRTRGGSTFDGADPPGTPGGDTPAFLACTGDYTGYLRTDRFDSIGFRCCAP